MLCEGTLGGGVREGLAVFYIWQSHGVKRSIWGVGMDAVDWRDMVEERAAILEFDCGLSRDRAEAQAKREMQAAWDRWHGAN